MDGSTGYEHQKKSVMPVDSITSSDRAGADQKRQFKVSGMTCANCALAIEKKLKGSNGVNDATGELCERGGDC